MRNQAFPVKVAPPNSAFPVKVAMRNAVSPVKVALRKLPCRELGAHYTHEVDIMKIVTPTIIRPLARADCGDDLADTGTGTA
jgi:hypothetical protein